ncbi:MAG: major facilitator superfamily 1 [Betaproteobacteria bacterium]|nr:major facilitator superfamily 1 [Betaproteobacteria bacterium]
MCTNESNTPILIPSRVRWIVFGLGASAFWLSFFHRVAPAALASELTRTFDVSGAALGALAATYFYVYALMQLPAGVLADTLGPRKLLTAGTLLAGIGSLLFAGAGTLATAAIGRTLVGLGVSVVFICVLKSNADWFDERRFATATGLANVVGIVGAFAATVPLAWLITVVSWRSVFAAVGVGSIALAALIWWKAQDAPARARAANAARDPWYRGLIAVVRNRATWPPFWVNFGLSGTNMSFIGLWAVPFLIGAHGMSAVVASRHTSLMLAGYACATGLVGWWSDRLQRRRPLMLGAGLLYLACWIAWLIGVPPGWTYVVAFLMGTVVSGLALSWACAKEVNEPAHAGMATSVANVGGFLAAGILQPLVGWTLDTAAPGDYRPALVVFALFTCTGLAGAVFIRETRCRNIHASMRRCVSG